MPDEADHDILIRIDERLAQLEAGFANHLRHHWYIEAGLVLALLTVAFKMFFN